MDWVLFNFMRVGLIYFPWQEDQKHQFKNSKVTGDAGEDGYVDCHHKGGVGKVCIATGQLSILQTGYAYLRLILKGVMCIVDLSWTTNEYPFQCDCAPQRRNWLLVLRPSVSQSTYKIEISVGGYSFRLLHHLMCKFRNCCWIDQSLHSQHIL